MIGSVGTMLHHYDTSPEYVIQQWKWDNLAIFDNSGPCTKLLRPMVAGAALVEYPDSSEALAALAYEYLFDAAYLEMRARGARIVPSATHDWTYDSTYGDSIGALHPHGAVLFLRRAYAVLVAEPGDLLEGMSLGNLLYHTYADDKREFAQTFRLDDNDEFWYVTAGTGTVGFGVVAAVLVAYWKKRRKRKKEEGRASGKLAHTDERILARGKMPYHMKSSEEQPSAANAPGHYMDKARSADGGRGAMVAGRAECRNKPHGCDESFPSTKAEITHVSCGACKKMCKCKTGELPPGWTLSGLAVRKYAGPSGMQARTVPEAWRKSGGAQPGTKAYGAAYVTRCFDCFPHGSVRGDPGHAGTSALHGVDAPAAAAGTVASLVPPASLSADDSAGTSAPLGVAAGTQDEPVELDSPLGVGAGTQAEPVELDSPVDSDATDVDE
jgi:hypothetical protein